MTHSFNLTNDKYFDEWADHEDELFEDNIDSDDSESSESGVVLLTGRKFK